MGAMVKVLFGSGRVILGFEQFFKVF